MREHEIWYDTQGLGSRVKALVFRLSVKALVFSL
jgi:hypothetical protein